jgi:hypothetical protein
VRVDQALAATEARGADTLFVKSNHIGGNMEALSLSLLFLGLLAGSPGLARAQTGAPPQKLDEAQGAALKVLKSLPNKYPDETVLKQIERMVVMEIVVVERAYISPNSGGG